MTWMANRLCGSCPSPAVCQEHEQCAIKAAVEFNESAEAAGNPLRAFNPHPSGFVTKDSGERREFDTGAKRDTVTGKPRYILIPPAAKRRWAELMGRGAEKYGDNNWQKGMPYSVFLDSLERHLEHLKLGDLPEEDHLAGILFNAGAIMHFQAHGDAAPDGTPLNDLIA